MSRKEFDQFVSEMKLGVLHEKKLVHAVTQESKSQSLETISNKVWMQTFMSLSEPRICGPLEARTIRKDYLAQFLQEKIDLEQLYDWIKSINIGPQIVMKTYQCWECLDCVPPSSFRASWYKDNVSTHLSNAQIIKHFQINHPAVDNYISFSVFCLITNDLQISYK